MSVKKYSARVFNGLKFSETEDIVSVEVPLSISVNGIPFTTTMQTPGNENNLVRGLLYTEGIYQDLENEPSVRITSKDQHSNTDAVEVSIPPGKVLKNFANTRNLLSASSCGMCGKAEFEETSAPGVKKKDFLRAELVPKMFEMVSAEQGNFKQSGGTHAAGAFTISGELLCVQEDIGRHNAVDKVIGCLLNQGSLHLAKCLTVSGRISFEIVNKVRSAGIPFLAAVSAPSSMAIEKAQEAGISLMAFCRGSKFTVYSNAEQVLQTGVLSTEHNTPNHV
ncbi:MAG TPA: formate dehydrogenase accessory sulfurtransferase FdhD [Bacteroidia bacterium]|nr:formate dehydrogenase accessory sulfurtransferase FdhD [Bacteroidia bacterium]